MGDINVYLMSGCSVDTIFVRKLTGKCGNMNTKLGKLQASPRCASLCTINDIN